MGTKFGISAASSSEVSDERAKLAKLSLNFRKSSKPRIFLELSMGDPDSRLFLFVISFTLCYAYRTVGRETKEISSHLALHFRVK